MTEYKKLAVKRYPRLIERSDAETRYWQKFKSQVRVKEYAPITSVQFCAASPYDFAVTSSTRVQIYSIKTHAIKKTVSRFTDTAHGASFRRDGRLLCAGDASGTVQVFDMNSRAVLRQFRGHSASSPVHCTQFLPDNIHVVSASDDRSVRVWDIPAQAAVQCWDAEHSDNVRALTVSRTNPNIIVSGSYDHTVRVWDVRQARSCLTLHHSLHHGAVRDGGSGIGLPVEAVLTFPGDAVIVSAAGNNLVAWDILGGMSGRVLHSGSNHQKTITSLAFDGGCRRVLTGSLDQHVKVYDTADYRVTHSFKYPSPVLAVGLSPDDSHVVAGTVSGLLSIRERVRGGDSADDAADLAAHMDDPLRALGRGIGLGGSQAKLTRHERDMQRNGGSYKFFMRGQFRAPAEDDVVISSGKKPKLKRFEKLLKKFHYGQALDEALSSSMPTSTVMTLLEELIRRGDGLRIALSSRDDTTLEPILQFIVRNLTLPRHVELLIVVLDCLLDIYSGVAHTSPIIWSLLKKTRRKCREELTLQKEMSKLTGLMDMMMSFSEVTTLSPEPESITA